MIDKVNIKRFKKFDGVDFVLKPYGLTLLIGSNNSGKSSFFQAMMVWQLGCRAITKAGGVEYLIDKNKQGVGRTIEQFTALALPDFSHLLHERKRAPQGDYSTWINCEFSNLLEVSFNVKVQLNVQGQSIYFKSEVIGEGFQLDDLPVIAYVPPVAGIEARERKYTKQEQRVQLGRGYAGAVLRNVLLELYNQNLIKRKKISYRDNGGRERISRQNLRELRQTDPWEKLQEISRKTLQIELKPREFDDEDDLYISLDVMHGVYDSKRPYSLNTTGNYKADLMSLGSGAMQFICVMAYALSPEINVLLLDEPDAHMHFDLARVMFEKLGELADAKQIIVSTHSSDQLAREDARRVFYLDRDDPKRSRYLVEEDEKTSVGNALGVAIVPLLAATTNGKVVFIVEGPTDEAVIRALLKRSSVSLDQFYFYQNNEDEVTRRKLSKLVQNVSHDTKFISLCDRDSRYEVSQIDIDTLKPQYKKAPKNWLPLMPRAKHIEGLLMHSDVLKRYFKFSDEVWQTKTSEHSLAENFTPDDKTIMDFEAKAFLKSLCDDSLDLEVYSALTEEFSDSELPRDMKNLVKLISDFLSETEEEADC